MPALVVQIGYWIDNVNFICEVAVFDSRQAFCNISVCWIVLMLNKVEVREVVKANVNFRNCIPC